MHLADPNSLAWIKHLSNDPEAMNILIIGQLLQYVVSDVSGSRGEMEIDQVKTTLIRLLIEQSDAV